MNEVVAGELDCQNFPDLARILITYAHKLEYVIHKDATDWYNDGQRGKKTMESSSTSPAVQLPVMLVAEVQDSLLVVVHDLTRLDGLLAHTMENLMERFTVASANLESPSLMQLEELELVRSTLRAAVTELQFQDMASQLIVHTSKILQGCAYRLASESMGNEDGEAVPFVEAVPDRPNPVTQDEMDAGSIELF